MLSEFTSFIEPFLPESGQVNQFPKRVFNFSGLEIKPMYLTNRDNKVMIVYQEKAKNSFGTPQSENLEKFLHKIEKVLA